MSNQVEKLEHNMVKITVTVPAADFDKARTQAYKRQKKNITLPGFRKGHAPQQLIEKMYGPEVFYEDAANICINNTYGEEAESTKLEFVSRPTFDVTQMEKGKDFIYTAEVAVRPEVKLGEYKGIEVKKQEINVTDEDVDKEIQKEQEKNSRLVDVTDRPVEDGDTVVLDYAGFVGDDQFEGGTAENQTLVIGSNTFIPGFEEQLVGAKIDEEKDVKVTFPEKYHAEDLAGKEAVFKCTVHKIQKKELPEINDEFAQDVSEFDTLADYKEDVRKKLTKQKEDAAKTEKENQAVDKLIESSEMDIPDAMVDAQTDQSYQEFAQNLRSQGIPIEMYLQYQGTDEKKLKEDMRPGALKQIQTRLVLEAVAKAENIEISDEKVDEEIQKIADQYKMKFEDLKKSVGDYEREQMKKDLAVQEAVTVIADNAKEV